VNRLYTVMHRAHDTVNGIDLRAERYLQRSGRQDLIDYLSGWLTSEPKSPDSLKLMYIESLGEGVDDFPSLDDPSTWGDIIPEELPDDAFFAGLFDAIQADEARNRRRRPATSYD